MCKLARSLPSELITVFFDAHPSKLITAVYWYWMHIPENMSNAATMNCVNLDRAEKSLTIDGEEHPSATLGGGIGNISISFVLAAQGLLRRRDSSHHTAEDETIPFLRQLRLAG